MSLGSVTFGFVRESSNKASCFPVGGMMVLVSKALLRKPKSISSSVLLQVDVGFVFGGLICRDKSGCAGNSSISNRIPPAINRWEGIFSFWSSSPCYISLLCCWVNFQVVILGFVQIGRMELGRFERERKMW